MTFAKGVLGVVIVIAAIMVTVLAGIMLNTNEVTVEKQEFTYVTPITGLFEHTNVDEYLDYNPIENWTGYRELGGSPTSGITFQTLPSGQSNLYPVNNDRVTGTGLNTMTSALRNQAGPFNRAGYDTVFQLYSSTDTGMIGTATSGITTGSYSDIQTMARIVDSLNLASTVTEIRIDMNDANTDMLINRISDWTRDTMTVGSTTQTWTADLTAAEAIDWVNVNITSGIVRAMTGDNVAWTSNTNDVVGLIRGRAVENGTYTGDWEYLTIFYDIVEGSGVEYMDTSQGVTIEYLPAGGDTTTGAVQWTNGHRNDRIDVLVHTPELRVNSNVRNEWTMNVAGSGSDAPSTWWVGISLIFRHDRVEVYSNRILTTFGQFDTMLVTADTTTKTFRITPVIEFNNFDDYRTIPDAAFETPMTPYNRAPEFIDWIAFGSMVVGPQTQPPTMGVVNTRVFMNSYNAVVTNETIRISEWFPDYSLYRIQFNSFGLVGTSMAIGSATYPVTDGTIKVTVSSGERVTIPLDRVTVTYEKVGQYWKISVSSEKTKPVVLTSGASTDTIGFIGGYWLFSSGLYKGETVTVTTNELDLAGWAFDNDLAVVTFFGFLVLGTAVSTRIQTVSVMDLAVVGCAGLCGWVLMGVRSC